MAHISNVSMFPAVERDYSKNIEVFYVDKHEYSLFMGMLGAVIATVFCGMGSAYGTAKSAVALVSISSTRPDLIMKSLLPVIMAGIISIYGLIMSLLIINDIKLNNPTYTDYGGFIQLAAGTAVGLCGLASGFAIGIVGDSGIRANHLQNTLYIVLLLILIFAEILGLYGLIVSVILYTKLH